MNMDVYPRDGNINPRSSPVPARETDQTPMVRAGLSVAGSSSGNDAPKCL
jgi:hypothetical protein